jgi:ATP-dependent helicase HrpB
MTLDTDHLAPLPMDSSQREFTDLLGTCPLVVSAPTGSGKSTRLPLWAAEHGPVLVVEPRRMACRSLAHHLARATRTRPGEEIGFAVRHQASFSRDSSIVFATPGVALRWLAGQGLQTFATVILDEYHERRWDTDLLAALLRGTSQNLVIASATLDGPKLAGHFQARLLTVSSRQYEVQIRYAGRPTLPGLKDLDRRAALAIREALKETPHGDILVFLPGKGEIRAVKTALEQGRPEDEVVELHAGARPEVQDRVLEPADHRRIILSTNVAETSLTLPGVRAVIDSGLERRTHHRNGRTVLGLCTISQAAADQRSGRAGRLGPGLGIRLWGAEAKLEPFTPPEIVREELTELFLAAAACGRSADRLDFPEALPDHARAKARSRLQAMQAVGPDFAITEFGRALFALPVDPFLAYLIMAMASEQTRSMMVDLAAALSVQGFLLQPPRSEQGKAALKAWSPEPCDPSTLIRLVRTDPSQELSVNTGNLAEARRIADQIRNSLGLPRRSPDEPFPRLDFLTSVLRAAPELAFVRRAKRPQAMGNEQIEVQISKESRFPDKALAGLVFDQHSIPARGTQQTINLAVCIAPVPASILDEADLGSVSSRSPSWDGQAVWVTQSRVFAGRELTCETVRAQGHTLRQAVTELVLRGSMLKPAGARIREDIAAWNLYLHLGYGRGSPAEPSPWLLSRLEEIGVETDQDLAALEPEDLVFEGIPDWERESFERSFPRTISLQDLHMKVEYDPLKKQIELIRTGGVRKAPPQRWELPSWGRNWTIRFRRDSKVVLIN